jgi:hypothetical protein
MRNIQSSQRAMLLLPITSRDVVRLWRLLCSNAWRFDFG